MTQEPEVSDNWALIEGAPPIWIPLLPAFAGTPWRDRGEYSRAAAGWVWRALGSQLDLAPQEREAGIERLSATVMDAYETSYARAHQVFLFVPALDVPPLPVFLNLWKMDGDRDARLRFFAGASAADTVRSPIVEEFRTEHLGRGLRVFRVARETEGSTELTGVLGYAFRSEPYSTDVQLVTGSSDLGYLQACRDGLDEFAGCIVPTRSPDAMGT
jgi:hypothetical protein